jgi:GTPase SAR1 family protein
MNVYKEIYRQNKFFYSDSDYFLICIDSKESTGGFQLNNNKIQLLSTSLHFINF